jgi:MFS family permease
VARKDATPGSDPPEVGIATSGTVSRRAPRIFYGWWIVGVGAIGLAAVSAAATIAAVGQGVTGPVFGWAADRLGPRLLMPAGAAIAGLALLGLSRADALWQLYLGYFVLAAGLNGMGMVVVGPAIAHWRSTPS